MNLLRRAVEIRPKSLQTLNNLGNALRLLGRPSEAVGAFRQGVEMRAESAEARNNLGVALQESGDVAAAVATLREAARLRPTYAEAQWNLALALLLWGDLSAGWLQYEWRKRLKTDRDVATKADAADARPAAPEWNGCDITGRAVLVRCEQGLGDTIQFVRYASLLKAHGAARVVLECQARLGALMRGARDVVEVIERGQPLPLGRFDTHVRMLSLPGIFRTTRETIPADGPYLRVADERVGRWREKLAAFSGFKVGVAWQGSPNYGGDHLRSIPLAAFEPLAKVGGVRLFSLQKGAGAEQLESVRERFVVHDFSPPLDDQSAGAFVDTAAVIMCLDLVITSDTAVAHLAGALGRPVWVALSASPDWRWMTEGEASPWYPTMRLFRQPALGDWRAVFERMAVELADLAGSGRPVNRVPVEVSPGELVDRLTILDLKCRRIAEPAKLARVRAELSALRAAAGAHLPPDGRLDELTARLGEVNAALWEVEDALREREGRGEFGEEFVALARAVYHANDRRAELKRRIDELLGARPFDVKCYAAYGSAEEADGDPPEPRERCPRDRRELQPNET